MPEKAYQIVFNEEEVDEEFYSNVASLTVEENTATASAFVLQLTTTLQDDGSWNYLEDTRFALFTKVSIKIGFTDGAGLAGELGGLTGGGNEGLEPVFDGYITAVHVSLDSQSCSGHIEVQGMDTSVLMSLEEKIATWPDLSDSNIIQQIVSGYVDFDKVKIDRTPTVHKNNDTTIVQRGTDIQFVRDLAQRNGLEFYFETAKDSGDVIAY